MASIQKIKTTILSILAATALMLGNSGYSADLSKNGNIENEPSIQNSAKLSLSIHTQSVFNHQSALSKLKAIFPDLIIYTKSETTIDSFTHYDTNIGNIYINDQGDTLIKAQSILLVNYDQISLDSEESIKEFIEKNTSTTIKDSNIDNGLRFSLTKNNLTIISNEKISGKIKKDKYDYAIIGMFLDEKAFNDLVGKINSANKKEKKEKKVNAVDKGKMILNAINHIKNKYPDNFVTLSAHDDMQRIYGLKDDAKSIDQNKTIYVFTDYTCPHCKGFHKKLNRYIEQGYFFEYILLPRKGVDSDVAAKMQAALCSSNPESVINTLFDTGNLPSNITPKANCTANIAINAALASSKINIQGTPTFISGKTGAIVEGFRPSLLSDLQMI
ncbi:thioredoxin fold domain-containing protein [Cysteiniphilum marinum]|uniref:thioredoxin fold domain-containing protein n=1 Tax=Cysteiniphilum marinum TaxID=2774191 RepID=UPI00193B3A56|nr:thioredoxin fold domain-containing protein [Cysteiniphilum marinum]